MMDFAERRKEYVSLVRESFEKEQGRQEEPAGEPVGTWWMRVRFYAALLLFALFFYWQGSGEEFYGYTSGMLIDRIAETRYDALVEQLLDQGK